MGGEETLSYWTLENRYTLTRDYYENKSLGIVSRNFFSGITCRMCNFSVNNFPKFYFVKFVVIILQNHSLQIFLRKVCSYFGMPRCGGFASVSLSLSIALLLSFSLSLALALSLSLFLSLSLSFSLFLSRSRSLRACDCGSQCGLACHSLLFLPMAPIALAISERAVLWAHWSFSGLCFVLCLHISGCLCFRHL